ncbi:MAG: winged helix-turn-helix domain-containing protein [Ekhidna sp.]|nr:winged helix-turn-helix domain-containing protein [Ekhidna sp.]
MRVVDYVNLIQESPEELRVLLKAEKHPKLRERLQVLLWLKSGTVSTMKEAMKLLDRTTQHGLVLWRIYKSKGLSGLLTLKTGQGRYSPLRDKPELEKKLAEDGFSTVNEARAWILETYGISYTENGLGNYFRANKSKLKTGRPSHPKKDEQARQAYKKIPD